MSIKQLLFGLSFLFALLYSSCSGYFGAFNNPADPNNSTISTFAGDGTAGFAGDGNQAASAELNDPRAVAVDSKGNLYILDYLNYRVREVTALGTISTVAGTGTNGSTGDGGAATSAEIRGGLGIAVDSSGNLYIPDGSVVRKVSQSGLITTVAGNGTFGYTGDGGSALGATLEGPLGVAVDSSGNLYIADSSANVVRKVDTSGIITTVAGSSNGGFGGDGGLATSAQLSQPNAVAVDSNGNLYIADSGNNRIRKVNTSGVISTVAGNGKAGYSGDGGPATSAELNDPTGIAIDTSGTLYIADFKNNRIRVVDSSGNIATYAGSGTYGFKGDGGSAPAAELAYPGSVAVDSSGNLYIADRGNERVREVK